MLSTTIILLAMTATDVPTGSAPLMLPSLAAVVQNADDNTTAIDAAAMGAPLDAPMQAVQPLGDPFPVGFELDWLGSFADNLRLTIDVSGRVQYNSASEQWSTTQFYGFDLYKVFSGPRGDIATMVLQGFATRLGNAGQPPYFFDGPTDWQWIWRMFFVNWRLDPRGTLNVKTGHFEMPFGLEALLDTNGTLRQVDTARNLGIKADWGVTLNGVTQDFEYEVGVGRGSGNEWRSDGDPYLVTGRIGTAREADAWVGVSGFSGHLWRPGGAQVRRQRVGVDTGTHCGPWTLMGQASFGTNDDVDTRHYLAELDWQGPDDAWLVYGQVNGLQQNTGGWQDAVKAVVGMEWAWDKHTLFSVQLIRDVTTMNDAPHATVVQMQLRYRF